MSNPNEKKSKYTLELTSNQDISVEHQYAFLCEIYKPIEALFHDNIWKEENGAFYIPFTELNRLFIDRKDKFATTRDKQKFLIQAYWKLFVNDCPDLANGHDGRGIGKLLIDEVTTVHFLFFCKQKEEELAPDYILRTATAKYERDLLQTPQQPQHSPVSVDASPTIPTQEEKTDIIILSPQQPKAVTPSSENPSVSSEYIAKVLLEMVSIQKKAYKDTEDYADLIIINNQLHHTNMTLMGLHEEDSKELARLYEIEDAYQQLLEHARDNHTPTAQTLNIESHSLVQELRREISEREAQVQQLQEKMTATLIHPPQKQQEIQSQANASVQPSTPFIQKHPYVIKLEQELQTLRRQAEAKKEMNKGTNQGLWFYDKQYNLTHDEFAALIFFVEDFLEIADIAVIMRISIQDVYSLIDSARTKKQQYERKNH